MRAALHIVDERSALPQLGEVLDFLRVMWAVDHALQRSSRHMETTTGVTSAQRLIVGIIGRFPGIPAGHLASLLHVHPGTLTGIVKRLERRGLVARRPDPRDGRRSLLGLTSKGRLFDMRTEAVVEEAVQRVLESTQPAKLKAAREVLESIAAALSDRSTHPSRTIRSDR